MGHWSVATSLAVLATAFLLVAWLLLKSIGNSREAPAAYRWFALFAGLFLVAIGFFVLLSKARETGNWPWGLVAVWCILAGIYSLLKLGRQHSGRSGGTNAKRA